MVIIMGRDRAEYCNVKKKYKEKHFFRTREQLYRVRPEGLSRMRINYFGKVKGSDEVVVYRENEIIPYQNPCNINYSMDNFMRDIDRHKIMAQKNWFGKKNSWFSGQGKSDLKKFIFDPTFLGILLCVIIVGPMLIQGLVK